jgi:hypothetical protein
MRDDADPNPFHLLGLPSDATAEEIVRRAEELSTLADSDADRSLFNWARQELIRDSFSRSLHTLLEAPGAEYRDDQWARFDRRHRRNPANIAALAEDAGRLRSADFALGVILDLLLDGLLIPPDGDVRTALRHPPVSPGPGASPLEVSDVLFG